MRRFLRSLTVAAAVATAVVPAVAGAEDAQRARELSQMLYSTGNFQGQMIGIRADGGTVFVKGEVDSQQHMQEALRFLASQPGVTQVKNGLTLRTAGAQPSASSLSNLVRQRDNNVRPAAAEQMLEPVAPAPLNVSTGADSAKSQEIADQLASTPGLEGLQIGVKYTGGTVELRGMVQHPAQRIAAQAVVSQRGDVNNVKNGLQAGPVRPVNYQQRGPQPARRTNAQVPAAPVAMGGGYVDPVGVPGPPMAYDQPTLPNYAWPSYAAHPNYAALTYPTQHSASAWPYIGPFYPYPQVPLGWRKVTLEWDDGWWFLDFKDH